MKLSIQVNNNESLRTYKDNSIKHKNPQKAGEMHKIQTLEVPQKADNGMKIEKISPRDQAKAFIDPGLNELVIKKNASNDPNLNYKPKSSDYNIPENEENKRVRSGPLDKEKPKHKYHPKEDEGFVIPQARKQLIQGDILLRVKNRAAFSNSLICRVCFNTSFIFSEQMKYTIKDVDPVSVRKDDRFSHNFKLVLKTQPFCNKCTSQTPIKELCKTCKVNLEDEIKKWRKIHAIIKYHKTTYFNVLNFKSAAEMHFFHSNNVDYYEILGKEKSYRKQSFVWEKNSCD